MNIPYVSIETHDNDVVLKVKIGDNACQRYPLTKNGCRQAGRDLHTGGYRQWLHSSSVDHPTEYKKSFRFDVRELMQEGFQAEQDKADAPKKSLIAKIFAHCAKQDFFNTLTDDEKGEFAKLQVAID